MKQTINYLGTFGLIALPIAITIAIAGIYFLSQVIAQNINLY